MQGLPRTAQDAHAHFHLNQHQALLQVGTIQLMAWIPPAHSIVIP